MKNSNRKKNATIPTLVPSAISERDHKFRGNEGQQRKTTKMLYIFSASCFAILAVAVSYLYMKVDPLSSVHSTQDEEWNLDDDFYTFSKSDDVDCDFPIIQAKAFDKKKQRNMDDLLDHPFIIRGMMTHWPANERWSKANFTRLFGDNKVKLGSESSIVYGGGSAALHSELRNVLQDMYQCRESSFNTINDSVKSTLSTTEKSATPGSKVCDSFIFDVSILRSIPELGRDFRVPGTRTFCTTSIIMKFLQFLIKSFENIGIACDNTDDMT